MIPIRQILQLILLSLLLNACATPSANHISAFSSAGSRLTHITQQVLNTVNTTTVDRKLYQIATLPEEKVKTLSAEDFEKVRGIYLDKEKNPVLKALTALHNYIEALGSLSSADYRSQVDDASEKLYGSLQKMSGVYTDMTNKTLAYGDKEYAAIAALFDGIGIAIIEAQRRKAIKEIIVSSNPNIILICDAIANNIGNDLDLVKINMDRVIRERIEAYKKGQKDYPLARRVRILRKIGEYSTDLEKLPQLFQDAKTATEKLKQAHQILTDAVLLDQFTSAKMAQSIGDLRNYGDHMKKHYKILSQSNNGVD